MISDFSLTAPPINPCSYIKHKTIKMIMNKKKQDLNKTKKHGKQKLYETGFSL